MAGTVMSIIPILIVFLLPCNATGGRQGVDRDGCLNRAFLPKPSASLDFRHF